MNLTGMLHGARLLQLAGFPTPEILGAGDQDEGWAYVLMSRLHGAPLDRVLPGEPRPAQERAMDELGEVVARLHALLRPLLPPNRFATAVVGWLADDGTLRVTNAGHCPPLVVRTDGSVDEIPSTGPAVAILPSSRWQSTTMALVAGEMLVLYSDGVIESASADGGEFGTRGLLRALPPDACRSRQVAGAIVEAVDCHTGGRREDDLTVVVIRAGGN